MATAAPGLSEQDPRPVVALPRAGLPGAAIAGLAIIAALLLFVALEGHRRAGLAVSRVPAGTADAFPPPPALTVPPEPAPSPVVVTVPMQSVPIQPEPPRFLPEPPPAFVSPPPTILPIAPTPAVPARPTGRTDAPALVIDGGADLAPSGTASSAAPAPRAPGAPGQASGPGIGGDDAPARASLIGNQATTMPVGTIIPAVLETPIDTARPGLVRAVVSQDARGFDGRRVLVPRGSRLIGEYQADVRPGQNRVLVTWTRLIRPDGVAIRLGSPAADPLGGAGVPGRVNTFFLQRFTAAVLQSALTVGVNLASRPGNGSVIVGLPSNSFNNVVGQGLLGGNYQPKITVKQGAALNVFVARDLDFSGVPTRP